MKKINVFFYPFLLGSLLFAHNEQGVQIEAVVPPLQVLELSQSKNFDNLQATHLNDGYFVVEDCVSLEVKSNIPWVVSVYFDSQPQNNDFQLKTEQQPFFSPSTTPRVLFQSEQPTSSELLTLDCKRIVGWQKNNSREWNYSPIFRIDPLYND
jgi:hypothetical protein